MVNSSSPWSTAGLFMAAVLLCLSMAGCSLQDTLHRSEYGSKPGKTTAVSRTDCTHVERDLTLPWDQRHYWCIPQRVSIKPPTQNVIQRRAANLLAKPPSSESKVEAEISNRIQGAEHHSQTTDNRVLEEAHRIQQYTIPFARGSQVLGSQGRTKVTALFSKAKTARRIELRSVTIEAGSKAWKDALAAARVLAVHNMLIDAGVTRDKIRILQRDADEKARGVVVVLHE